MCSAPSETTTLTKPAVPPRIVALLMLALWGCACTLGFLHAAAYSATPGQGAIAPRTFPKTSKLVLAADRPTLFVFLHPRCPCSQATLDKLEELSGALRGAVPHVVVVMYVPGGASQEWIGGDLWERSRKLANLVLTDENGLESRRFGAYTSGHCALYSSHSKLLYSGGLTDSRGHAGPSVGSQALLAILSNQISIQRFAPTFGCQISQEDARDCICR
jgi:hypothetical protein